MNIIEMFSTPTPLLRKHIRYLENKLLITGNEDTKNAIFTEIATIRTYLESKPNKIKKG